VVYLGVFLLALAVRALYLAEWHDTTLFSVLLGDGRAYDLWALEIAGGNWFGDDVFYQAPLYPYFLSVVYTLFGHELWAVRGVQALLGSVSCVFIAMAGRDFISGRVGLLAGLLLALYAPAVYYDGLIQKPSLSLFLMSLVLLLLGRFQQRPRWGWLLAAGASLACLGLTRETALILLPVVVLWLAVRFRDAPGGQRLAWVAILGLGVALLLVPVGLRNRALGDEFLITTAQLGPNLYIGNNPQANGKYVSLRPGRGGVRYERHDARLLAETDLGRKLGWGEVSAYWQRRSFDYVRGDPGGWLRLMAKKWHLVWHAREIVDTDSIEAYGDSSLLLRVLGMGFHFGVLAPLALLGLWGTRSQWRKLWLLYAILGSFACGVVVFYVLGRYRFPLVPVLLLFAAAGVTELWEVLRSGRRLALAGSLLVLAVAGAVSNWPLRGVDPRATTYFNLGMELTELGRPAEAEVQLRTAIGIAPELSYTHMLLGDALQRQGKLAESIPEYRTALRLSPRDAHTHTRLGIALAESGDSAGALRHYRTALGLDPLNGDAHNNLANTLLGRGRAAEAIEHYRRALALDPQNAGVHYNLATALRSTRAASSAVHHYREAIRLDPGHLLAHRFLAQMLAVCEEVAIRAGDEAVRLAQNAVRLTPGVDASILDVLAAAYAASGRFEQAIRQEERAIELAAPASASALRGRLELYRGGLPFRMSCGD